MRPAGPAIAEDRCRLTDSPGKGCQAENRGAPARRRARARRSWGYGAIEALGADATVTPLAAPAATIRVADLLP